MKKKDKSWETEKSLKEEINETLIRDSRRLFGRQEFGVATSEGQFIACKLSGTLILR